MTATPADFAELLGRAIEAQCVELTPEQIAVCAEDLTALHAEPEHYSAADYACNYTVNVWLGRIGGWVNVPGYADCLLVQKGKR